MGCLGLVAGTGGVFGSDGELGSLRCPVSAAEDSALPPPTHSVASGVNLPVKPSPSSFASLAGLNLYQTSNSSWFDLHLTSWSVDCLFS